MTDLSLSNLKQFHTYLYLLDIPLNVAIIIYWYIRKRLLRKRAIINVHGVVNIAPIIAAVIIRVPVVWVIHDTAEEFTLFAKIGNGFIRLVDHEIVVVAKKSVEVYNLNRTEWVPAFIDPQFWSADHVDLKAAQSWWSGVRSEERPVRLLNVGNLNRLKGTDRLLCSLREMSEPVELNIVGAELSTQKKFIRSLNELKESIEKNNPLVSINFMQTLPTQAIRELLATCDLFVLPSKSEACPIVLLEAMAMGVHITATDVGDVANMMKKYKYGLVVENRSSEELKKGLEIQIKNIRSSPLQTKNFDLGPDKEWTIEFVARKMSNVYFGLLNGNEPIKENRY